VPDEPGPLGVLRLPDQISFGTGSVASLAPEVAALGDRALVCADPVVATTPAFAAAVDALRDSGVEVVVDTGIAPELPVDRVHEAAERARAADPRVVVGFGGGSALDQAKLVALLLSHGGPLARYYGENQVPGPVLPLVAVPTTAGTGSEVTPVAVISDPDRELKVGVSSRYLVPRTAIVDPALTFGAPPAVTAHAGIDAFVHAVEAYTAGARSPEWAQELPIFVGRNRLSSLLALEAVGLIAANLRTAVADPLDEPARTAMAHGSLLAGMAFGSAGTHFSHALQYPVGALSRTPHGLGTGLLLPHVLAACRSATTAELADIGAAMGVPPGSPDERADAALAAVASLVADIGLPAGLGDIGVPESSLPRMAELAIGVARLAGNGPVPATRERFEQILTAASRSSSGPLQEVRR
jgi:alcohol dehydrogenase class IV